MRVRVRETVRVRFRVRFASRLEPLGARFEQQLQQLLEHLRHIQN